MTREEAIPRIQLLQAMIASKNKEDKEYVFALQMGIEALGHPKITRCKDCRKNGSFDCPLFTDAVEMEMDEDWYCADGERKEGDGDAD